MLQIDPPLLKETAERLGLELIVLFGSQARGTARPDSDMDLAVLGPAQLDGQLVVGALLKTLAPESVDLVLLSEATWLLAWEVARDGRPLYESSRGAFEEFRNLAARRRADCRRLWTQRDASFVQRFLKEDWSLNHDLVQRKLSRMVQYLGELAPILQHSRDDFVNDATLHHSGERLLELLVEAAAAINTEVAQAVAGVPAADYYSSFFSMSRTGWIDTVTATSLADYARVRNRLVHQYEDVTLPGLYDGLQASLPVWRQYVAMVQQHLEASA